MAELKLFLIEMRTKETQKRIVDEKIGIVPASSVKVAAKILGKKIKESFPDDPNSVILKTSSSSKVFNMLCLIELPVVDSPTLLSFMLKVKSAKNKARNLSGITKK